jgi:hypothetical protein
MAMLHRRRNSGVTQDVKFGAMFVDRPPQQIRFAAA